MKTETMQSAVGRRDGSRHMVFVVRRQVRAALLLAAGTLAAALVGCSDDGQDAGSAPAATSGSTTSGGQAVDPGSILAPVRAFLDGARNADQVADAFAADGVVIDVGRRFEGRDAIRQWARNEFVDGTLTVLQVVQTDGDRQRLLVRYAPGGSGGFEAHYTFTVAGDRLSQLEMQYT